MSSKNNKKLNIPEAREAGSVGGQMVKNIWPERLIQFERTDRSGKRHLRTVKYRVSVDIRELSDETI